MRGMRAERGECGECGHLRMHHREDNTCAGRVASPDKVCQCTGMVVELTERELEVLVLLSGGGTNKSMATSLEVSVKTIEAHRCNMAHKTDTHSVLELVLLALRSGIVTLGDLPHRGKIEPGKIENNATLHEAG